MIARIVDAKKHAIDHGCTIIDEKPFSLVASCDDGKIFIVKTPETRIKVLVNSPTLDDIDSIVALPDGMESKETSIGSFSKQGEWSRMIKLDNLDKVEFVFGEKELNNIDDPATKASLRRVARANAISHSDYGDVIEPFKIIREEIEATAGSLARTIEDSIASKAGDAVICSAMPLFQKSWNQVDNEKYHFSINVNCSVLPLLPKITSKVERVGGWRTMSESDSMYIKSIISPSKDAFLTGIKLKSPYGENQFEFELMNEDDLKNKDFINNFDALTKANDEFPSTPIDEKKVFPSLIEQ